MVRVKCFVYLILIFGHNNSVSALDFLPRSSPQVRENRIFDAEFEPSERSLFIALKRAKFFVKRIFFSIKFVLKKLRTAYRFLKPELKMGTCLTRYYDINPFGLRRRRRRSVGHLQLTPAVAVKLLRISDKLTDIQQTLAGIIYELQRSAAVQSSTVSPVGTNVAPAPRQAMNVNETSATVSNNVENGSVSLLERVDSPSNYTAEMQEIFTRHFPSRVIMYLFKKSPKEAVEWWKEAKNRTFWGWVKLIVRKIIRNKLLICSREYVGTRLWNWVDYGPRI